MRTKLLLLASAIVALSGCAQLGKLAGNLMTQSTTDLQACGTTVYYISNLYPPSVKSTEVSYMGEAWKEGRSTISVMNFKKHGIGFYKIDGVVAVDGTPMQHVAFGAYSKLIDSGDAAPKKITIETKTGQKAEFTIKPTFPVRIKSINGKTEGAEVDVTQDLVLELENPKGSERTMYKVSMLMDLMGTTSFVDVVVCRSADKIVIPHQAFVNAQVVASSDQAIGTSIASFREGASWLRIERYEHDLTPNAGTGGYQGISASWDTKPVTVKGKSPSKSNVQVTGEEKGFSFNVNKPNAYYGRALSMGKKFALASFSVRGTIFHQDVKSSTSTQTMGNVEVTTTTTTITTLEFPQLPDEFWDKLLDNMYNDFVTALKNEHQIELIPVENVTKASGYAAMEPIEDKNTQVKIVRSYKGTKNLLPTSIVSILKSVSSTFASDRPDARLMRELGVDGLISATLDLQISKDANNHVVLNPVFTYQLLGPPNGYLVGTQYVTGTVLGQGAPFNEEAVKSNPYSLNSVVRKEDMMAAFRKSIVELKKLEEAEGYTKIWNLQK